MFNEVLVDSATSVILPTTTKRFDRAVAEPSSRRAEAQVEEWVAKGMSGEEHCMSQASSPLLPTNYKHPYKAIYFSENHVHAVSSKNVCINDKFYNTPNMAPCKLTESTLFLPKKGYNASF